MLTHGKFDAMVDHFDDRMKSAVGDAVVYISYSAYDCKDDITVDNMDEIAVVGTVCFKHDYKSRYKACDYKSRYITDPTWLDVAVFANKSVAIIVEAGCDTDHRYFEGIYKVRGRDGDVYGFRMGS